MRPWAATSAALMAVACRISIGGMGMSMGTLVILSSTGIGLLDHYRLRGDSLTFSATRLYLFGVAVHAVMLVLMATLPQGHEWAALKRLGPSIMLLYPLATVLAGKILSDQVAPCAMWRCSKRPGSS